MYIVLPARPAKLVIIKHQLQIIITDTYNLGQLLFFGRTVLLTLLSPIKLVLSVWESLNANVLTTD